MNDTPTTRRSPKRLLARRGSAYVVVLTTSAMVSLLALAAFSIASDSVEEADAGADAQAARTLARAAVEIGVQMLHSSSDWRTDLGNGDWVTDLPLADGLLTITAIDPADNDVTNNPADPLVIRGTAVVGDARQMLEVKLVAVPKVAEQNTTSLAVAGNLDIASATIEADETIHVGGALNALASDVEATIDLAGSLLAAPSRATVNTGATTPALRVNTSDYTQAIPAQPITDHAMTGLTLAPGVASHAFTANTRGVYHLQATTDLVLNDLIVEGTLIITGAPSVTLSAGFNLEPALVGWPTIVTDARLVIAPSKAEVPPTPESTWITNDLPTEINGPIITSTDLWLAGSPVPIELTGSVIVGGNARIAGEVDIESYDADDAVPPPALADYSTMALVEGSWRRWTN